MIYFIRAAPLGNIKIGTTVRLSVRLKQLAKEHETELTLLGVIDGSYADERALHDRFRRSRIPGTEWFQPNPDLMEFIDRETRPWNSANEVSPSHARIEMPNSDYERLQTCANQYLISVSAYIRQAVMERIQRDEWKEGRT